MGKNSVVALVSRIFNCADFTFEKIVMSIRKKNTFWLFLAFLLASTWTKKIQNGPGIPGKKNDCKVRKNVKSIWEMELSKLFFKKNIRYTGIVQSTTTATTATGLDRKMEKYAHVFIQV